jgi:hypothetical protein
MPADEHASWCLYEEAEDDTEVGDEDEAPGDGPAAP